MKKLELAAVLACTMIPGTVFASPNPYSFVPTSDWSYTDLDNLYQSGVFKDYTDVKFDKTQKLTRNQIAVLVAKAMAAQDYANADQKSMIGKLAGEYQKELRIIGVDEGLPAAKEAPATQAAEKKNWTDRVQLSGYYRLRYDDTHKNHVTSTTANNLVQIGATVDLENNWKANAEWWLYRSFRSEEAKNYNTASITGLTKNGDSYDYLYDDSGLAVANLAGPIGKANLMVGRFEGMFGSGIMFDDFMTGAQLSFGNKLKTTMTYGDATLNSGITDGATMAAVDLSYDFNKATNAVLSIQDWHMRDGSGNRMAKDISFTSKLANGYKVFGGYNRVNMSDNNYAWLLGVSNGKAKRDVVKSHGIGLEYECAGENASIDTAYLFPQNVKGFAFTYDYVPAKNVVWKNALLRGESFAGNVYSKVRTQVYYYFF